MLSTLATSAGFARSANAVKLVEIAEGAHGLDTLARGGQVEAAEALVAPLAVGGVADHRVGRDDQAVPLPPASVPGALAGQRHAHHRLGEQDETGDHAGLQKADPPLIDVPVAGRRDGVDDRAYPGHRREHAVRAAFAGGLVQRRQLGDRPDEPHGHGGENRPAQCHAVSHDERRERGATIDEPRGEGEQGGEDQADGIRDLEPRILVREEPPRSRGRAGRGTRPWLGTRARSAELGASPRRFAAALAAEASTKTPTPTARNAMKWTR